MTTPVYKGLLYKERASKLLVEMVESGDWHCRDFIGTLEAYAIVNATASEADLAYLAAVDRYFLLVCIFHRVDAMHPWLFDRCREVELKPDGYIDLWARDHYKSTIITYAGVIQEILNNPEVTIGIFSHTKPIAKAFVKQIKREIEKNEALRNLYPDIFWLKRSHAPLWTDDALIVKRNTNPKEATVEAHGLVDGAPVSKHFNLLVYDDVVTRESVNTPDQIKKTTEAWELSDNLGSRDDRRWYIGTRYSFADTYGVMLDRNIVKPRLYPATDTGLEDGKPVLLSDEQWSMKKRVQRSTLAAQMLQNPIAGRERMFQPLWLRSYEIRPGFINVYIMGDPSKGKSNRSDNAAISVVGVDGNNNKYLLDGYCHRMQMSERWTSLLELHKKWSRMPGVNMVKVGWERFGQQTDDEYFQEKMRESKPLYEFAIEELAWPRDNSYSKSDRVERLQPDFMYSRFFLPATIYEPGLGECTWKYDDVLQKMSYTKKEGDSRLVKLAKARGQGYLASKTIRRINENREVYDVTKSLIQEMMFFPFSPHDDIVDATSRIYDMDALAARMDDIPKEREFEDT